MPKCLDYKVPVQLNSGRSIEELNKVVFKQKVRILSVMIADAKRSIASLQQNKEHFQGKIDSTFEREEVMKVKKMVETNAVPSTKE